MTVSTRADSAHECIAEEQLIELVTGGCDHERALRLLAEVERCVDCQALMIEALRARGESSSGPTLWNSPTEAAHWELGALIASRYRIVRRLGSGGMGDVYEASDTDLSQPVALKTIAASFSRHETSLERLKQEVRLARRVVHPNVCRVLEFGRHREAGRDRYFLTMELLDGELLSTVLRREGRLAPHAARKIVQQVAEGLRAIHAQNIVHRDVKASNILLTGHDGGQSIVARRAVLLDFGIARSLDTQALPLTTHGRIGTPDYMAPEQIRGEAVSPATDVYALGLVLFELLSGRLPGGGEPGHAPLHASAASNELPSPATLPPEVPAELREVIRWCLARDPAARPQTMDALLHALKRAETEQRPPQHRRRWSIGRVAAVTGSVLVLALAAGAMAFLRSVPEVPSGPAAASQAAPPLAATDASSTPHTAPGTPPSLSRDLASPAAVSAEGSATDGARGRNVSAQEAPSPLRSAADAQRRRCSPPYYYDQHGIRIYRKECL